MRWNGSEWQIFPSPNPSDRYNWLYDAAAISSTDVWAVGAWFNQGHTDMLGMHWDGAQWTLMSPPGLGQLNAVSAVASNDVWAVGTYLDAGVFRARIAHWNGNQWITMPAPTFTEPSFLFSVTAVAANNVWAVGRTGNHPDYQSLIIHWNGSAWSVVPHPSVEQLMSVDASSAGDVWAVGDGTLHYNGTSWSEVPITLPANSTLQSVTAVAPGEAWLAGYYVGGSGTETLTYHWDGSAWAQVPSFNADNFNVLTAIDAVSSQDVWAVGHSSPGGGAPYSTMTGRFTPGSACQTHTPTSTPTVSSPTATRTITLTPTRSPTGTPTTFPYPCGVFPEITSSICEAPDALTYHFTFRTHHCKSSGNAMITLWVSPDRSGPWTAHDSRTFPVGLYSILEITGAFTDTNVPQQNEWYYISAYISHRSGSTTGETRPAPICDFDTCDNFTDVLHADYFYEAVCYLYAYGAISGYADGTFRPYNSTTRGQLTKIVVVAFNYPLYTPPTPTFSDVPATHTFYGYIETAVYEGLVSGYADGTFRPQNDITRGQLAKIVVEAVGWFLYNPTTPTFTDVPPTHTFYQHIETAYQHGIISGYADGTFRPGNNATRGQISKIVYNSVQQ
jgi:hypothetical protein